MEHLLPQNRLQNRRHDNRQHLRSRLHLPSLYRPHPRRLPLPNVAYEPVNRRHPGLKPLPSPIHVRPAHGLVLLWLVLVHSGIG